MQLQECSCKSAPRSLQSSAYVVDMRGEAFKSGQSSQAGHHVWSAALALKESFAYESFAYGSFMHLSPTEVKRQLVPEPCARLEYLFVSLYSTSLMISHFRMSMDQGG